MKQRFDLIIILCLFLTMLQNVSANDQTNRGTIPKSNFLSIGILTGIARHNIHFDDNYFNPDYIPKNRNLYFGVFTQLLFKKITIEASADYKNRALLLHNYTWDDDGYGNVYGYVLDLQMQYVNTLLKLGVIFKIMGIKVNLFAGKGNGYLVDAERKYVVDYGFHKSGHNSSYKDDKHMKKYLDRNSNLYTVGITFEPNAISERLNFGIDVDLFRPTNKYAHKEFEGNYDPLFQPLRLSSVNLYLKIKLFTI